MTIITIVSGQVPENRQQEFEDEFSQFQDRYAPDGLINGKLLRDEENTTNYQIQTLWEERDDFERFREQNTPLPGVALFQKMGSQTTMKTFEVREELIPAVVESV